MIVESKYFIQFSGATDEDIIRKAKPLYDKMIGSTIGRPLLERLLHKVIQIDGIVAREKINYNWSTSIDGARSALTRADQAKSSTSVIPGENAQNYVRRMEALYEHLTALIRDALAGLFAKARAVDIDGPVRHNWSGVLDEAYSELQHSPSLPKHIVQARVELLLGLGEHKRAHWLQLRDGVERPWY